METPKNMSYDKQEETVTVITPDDVLRFNKAQIHRANCNLFNAEKRGDKIAVENIKRKIALYRYTLQIAEYYKNVMQYDLKKIQEAGE